MTDADAGPRRVGLIWAEAQGGVIGARGGIPWHVPEDLAHFKQVTLGAPVIMGRRTWDSLPEAFRPLAGRRNIVVTRQGDWSAPGAERADSLDDALDGLTGRVWVIGGGELFADAIRIADLLEITEVDVDVAGDAFAPGRRGFAEEPGAADPGWRTSRTGIRYRFLTWRRSAPG